MDGRLARAGLRRLAHWLGVAARWCWEQAQPPWSVSPEGFRRYGRLLAREPGPPWKVVIKADPCVYCGRPSETVEHVEPRSAGGAYGWANEVGACKACNRAKGALGLLQFLRARHHAAVVAQSTRLPSAAAAVKRGGLTRRQRFEAEIAARNAQRAPQASPSRRQTRAFQSGGHR